MSARWGLSNSRECLASLRDKRIVGFMEGVLPSEAHLSKGTTTLVFDDGTGFTFNNSGAFWHESADDIARAIDQLRRHLEEANTTMQALLDMAGAKR